MPANRLRALGADVEAQRVDGTSLAVDSPVYLEDKG